MLGTGTAVPIKRGLPCILFKVDSDLYLFDVGEGCQQRIIKMGLGLVKVKAIFITHMHGDHYLGLFGLFQSMHLLDKNTELTIVSPPELIKLIEYYGSMRLIRIRYPFEMIRVDDGEVYSDNKIRVQAYSVDHGIPAWGYVIDVGNKYRIVYSGDTRPTENTIKVAEKADLLIHESTFTSSEETEAHEEGHSTAADAAIIASKAGVKNLVLTHISPRYSDPYEVFFDAYRFFRNVIVAEDYMIIYF